MRKPLQVGERSAAQSYLDLPVVLLFVLLASTAPVTAQVDPASQKIFDRLSWMAANQYKDTWNIDALEGVFLRDVVRKVKAKRGLEIGTSNGYSSLWISLALGETGGHLDTLEYDPERAAQAQENFRQAGVEHLVTLRVGDAFKSIPTLSGPYDFVFLDAWKKDYKRFLDLVLPLMREGGVLVAHDVSSHAPLMPDFLCAIQHSPQLKTEIHNPGVRGFSVSTKIPARKARGAPFDETHKKTPASP